MFIQYHAVTHMSGSPFGEQRRGSTPFGAVTRSLFLYLRKVFDTASEYLSIGTRVKTGFHYLIAACYHVINIIPSSFWLGFQVGVSID